MSFPQRGKRRAFFGTSSANSPPPGGDARRAEGVEAPRELSGEEGLAFLPQRASGRQPPAARPLMKVAAAAAANTPATRPIGRA